MQNVSPYLNNIVAAFRGMHVSPAKHSYAWLSIMCDYRTDRQTEGRQSDPYASQATQKYTQQVCLLIMFTRLCVHFDLELSNCPIRSFPSSSCAPSLKNIQQIMWFLSYVHNILNGTNWNGWRNIQWKFQFPKQFVVVVVVNCGLTSHSAIFQLYIAPVSREGPGVKSRMCTSVSQAWS